VVETGVIVLAFNEVASLKFTIENLIESLSGRSYKIVISTSTFATKECQLMAIELANKNQNVDVYFQIKPFVAAAILEATATLNTKYIVYMSADLETPPEIIPLMIDEINRLGVDIVSASRWINGGSFNGYGKIKYGISLLAQKVCKVVYPNGLTEFTYGFRLYKKEFLSQFNFYEVKHPFFLESLLIPLKFHARLFEIPVKWIPRTEGKSVVTFKVLGSKFPLLI
jgi:glycosyltransferase involved in cell wall biosynthesis